MQTNWTSGNYASWHTVTIAVCMSSLMTITPQLIRCTVQSKDLNIVWNVSMYSSLYRALTTSILTWKYQPYVDMLCIDSFIYFY
jgi:hypothetical protein